MRYDFEKNGFKVRVFKCKHKRAVSQVKSKSNVNYTYINIFLIDKKKKKQYKQS